MRNQTLGSLAGALAPLALTLAVEASPASAQTYNIPKTWNGLYLGLHASEDIANLSAQPGTAGWGGHIGYGLQFNMLVIGVEAEADRGTSVTSNVQSSTLYWDNHTNWTGAFRGRVGLALNDLQIYGTAGLAYRNVTTTLNRFGTIETNTASTPGTVYGAGFDYRILPKLDLRLEALHYDYGTGGVQWISNPGSLPSSLTDAQSDTVVRAGINVRMN